MVSRLFREGAGRHITETIGTLPLNRAFKISVYADVSSRLTSREPRHLESLLALLDQYHGLIIGFAVLALVLIANLLIYRLSPQLDPLSDAGGLSRRPSGLRRGGRHRLREMPSEGGEYGGAPCGAPLSLHLLV